MRVFRTHLHPIYSVPENYLNPLFQREITILEQRFSHNLYTHILKVESGNYDLIQEIIEAIINSNTNLKMHFLIFGNEEFVDYVSTKIEFVVRDLDVSRLTAANYLNKLADGNMLRKDKLGTGNYYINAELFELLTKR